MLELSPYFKSLARNPHMCPRCHGRLELRALKLTWDGAVWKCEGCGWFQVVMAPEAARMGPREQRAEPAGTHARIVKLDLE